MSDSHEIPKAPDFWLIECDTFWHDLGVNAVACTVVAGPEAMIENYDGRQWLVRVTPAAVVQAHDR